MAQLWQRWRAPILGGVAVWLLSMPLLMSHPAAAVASVARMQASVTVDTGDHAVVLGIRREHPAQGVIAPASPMPLSSTSTLVAHAAIAPAAPPRPAAPPAAPTVHANNIVIPRLGLNQPVGWYGDCLGRAAVPRWGTWRWSCAGANNIYIMAHNPGIFTPILALRPGDIIKYGDPSGRVHTYRVSYTTIVYNTQLWPLGATSSSSLTLQTCWTWDGSRDFIVRAIEL